MAALFRWLRLNSQKYLLEAAQAELARHYLGRSGPISVSRWSTLFWRRGFAPLYRHIPWKVRRVMILAMPGSNRRGWPPPSLHY